MLRASGYTRSSTVSIAWPKYWQEPHPALLSMCPHLSLHKVDGRMVKRFSAGVGHANGLTVDRVADADEFLHDLRHECAALAVVRARASAMRRAGAQLPSRGPMKMSNTEMIA